MKFSNQGLHWTPENASHLAYKQKGERLNLENPCLSPNQSNLRISHDSVPTCRSRPLTTNCPAGHQISCCRSPSTTPRSRNTSSLNPSVPIHQSDALPA